MGSKKIFPIGYGNLKASGSSTVTLNPTDSTLVPLFTNNEHMVVIFKFNSPISEILGIENTTKWSGIKVPSIKFIAKHMQGIKSNYTYNIGISNMLPKITSTGTTTIGKLQDLNGAVVKKTGLSLLSCSSTEHPSGFSAGQYSHFDLKPLFDDLVNMSDPKLLPSTSEWYLYIFSPEVNTLTEYLVKSSFLTIGPSFFIYQNNNWEEINLQSYLNGEWLEP